MNKIMSLCIVMIGAIVGSVVAQTNPGLKATITEIGLTSFMQTGVEVIEANLQMLSIPDVNGTQSVVGLKVDYWVTDIQINKLELPSDQLMINSTEEGLDVVISNVGLEVTSDWKYREVIWPHIGSNGDAVVTVNESSLTMSLILGETDGRISIASYKVGLSIGQLSIDLHGGASWFLQLFEDIFNNKIKESAEAAILDQISSLISNNLEPILATIPVKLAIDDKFEVDYQLVAPVNLNSDKYLVNPSKAEFFAINNYTEAPITPEQIPDIVPAYCSNAIQIILDEYVFQTLAYSVHNSKVLDLVVTDSMLPESSPLRLNTTYFTDLIPPLEQAYPDMMMDLYVHLPSVPSVNIDPSAGTTIKAEVEVEWIILPSNVTAFVLDVVVSLSVVADVAKTNLTGALTYNGSSMSILSTNIGTFDVSPLDEILDSAMSLGLIPIANKRFGLGFPLPSVMGIQFVNATVVNYDGYLLISTDVAYD